MRGGRDAAQVTIVASKDEPLTRYLVKHGEGLQPIDVVDIVTIVSAQDYSEVTTTKGTHLVQVSLTRAATLREFVAWQCTFIALSACSRNFSRWLETGSQKVRMKTIHAMASLALLPAPVSGEEIHINGTEIVSSVAPQITVEGQPLPYIPLEGDRRPYYTNTDFFEAKRLEARQAAEVAAIAVEQSSASFLWSGGGRDEVWASGQMARSLADDPAIAVTIGQGCPSAASHHASMASVRVKNCTCAALSAARHPAS